MPRAVICALLVFACCTGLRGFAQTIEVVSRATDAGGAVGDAASGTNVNGPTPSPVNNDGDVDFVSLAALVSVLDQNVVRDVYRRAGTTTSPLSISGVAPDEALFGNVMGLASSEDGSRIVTVRPATDLDTIKRLFHWDLSALPFSRTDLGNGSFDSAAADISGNGLFVAFATDTEAVVAADNNGHRDILIYSSIDGSFRLASVAHDDGGTDGDSTLPTLSSNGNRVAFLSSATNLLATGSNGTDAVFLRDLTTSSTVRLNNRIDGLPPSAATHPVISGNGNWVAFASADNGLVASDQNGLGDVFVVQADGTDLHRVSLTTAGAELDGASSEPAVSSDGRFVVFLSTATNIVSNPTGKQQVCLHDRDDGTTVVLSQVAGVAADNDCFAPAISANGRYVTFGSAATNLVSESLPAGVMQVFRVDRGEGFLNHVPDATAAVHSTTINTAITFALTATDVDGDEPTFVITTLPDEGQLFDGNSQLAEDAITVAGHVLNSSSDEVTYAPNTGVFGVDTFQFAARDAQSESLPSFVTITVINDGSGIITRVTQLADGTDADGVTASDLSNGRLSIAADGERVAYSSGATNLDTAITDSNGTADVLVWNRLALEHELASVNDAGATGDEFESSEDAALSPDGRYLAFSSLAQLADDDDNTHRDVYLRDLQEGTTALISRSATSGLAGDGNSQWPSVSEDGGWVVFQSVATDLTAEAPTVEQVYLWERSTGLLTLLSQQADEPANDAAQRPSISADGNVVVFESAADNLGVPTGGSRQVFLYNRAGAAIELVSIATDAPVGNGDSQLPVVSVSGRYVAFQSAATNLLLADDNALTDVFVRDMSTNATERISVAADDGEADDHCFAPAISASGRFVYFRSRASNLSTTDTAGVMSGYRHDRLAAVGSEERLRLVSHATSATVSGNADSWNASLSASGRYVAFASDASNLIDADANGVRDVFLADFDAPVNQAPTLPADSATLDNDEVVEFALMPADPDEDDLRVAIVQAPGQGELLLDTSITVTHPQITAHFTPTHGFVGVDSFQLSVSDGSTESFITFDLTVLSPNQAPTIDLDTDEAVTDTQVVLDLAGDAVAIIEPTALAISDDRDTLASATLAISNLQDGVDERLSATVNGQAISVDYDADTGELRLTGMDSVSNYSEVIQTITYDHLGVEPDTTPRLITVVVNDGEFDSNVANVAVFLSDDDISLTLDYGWNLLSMPFDTPPWRLLPELLQNAAETALADHVLVWEPVSGSYVSSNVIGLAHQGFWALRPLSSVGEDSATVVIPGRFRGSVVELSAGWNLIGPSRDVVASQVHGFDKLDRPIWFWDSVASRFVALAASDTFRRGQGYWVHVSEDGCVLDFNP